MADKQIEYVLTWVNLSGREDGTVSTFEEAFYTLPDALREMASLIEKRKGVDVNLCITSLLTRMTVFKWDNY